IRDREVGYLTLQVYNDWMLEEWCGAAPDRYIPCQMSWLADPVLAAKEVYRNAERGFRAISFSENPEGQGFPSVYQDHWDPFFAACEDTETVVNLHVGSSGSVHTPSRLAPADAKLALFPIHGINSVVDWIYAKVPLRFPRIKIALSEGGVSW